MGFKVRDAGDVRNRVMVGHYNVQRLSCLYVFLPQNTLAMRSFHANLMP